MTLNIKKEVATMQRMTVRELQHKYCDVFGESTNGRHKQWLIKRIAWRMQAVEQGGLSHRARQRAREIANEADLRTTAPKEVESLSLQPVSDKFDRRLPPTGNVIERVYKGTPHIVTVLSDGFEYDGHRYKSLSAVAKSITGQHWNGYRLFGLTGGKG